MNQKKIDHAALPLASLALPIYLENLFRIALSSIDVFMLSGYSDKAVAAVGLIGNFSFFLLILYNVVANGSSILISQHLGAGQQKKANTATLAAYIMGILFASVISTGIGVFAGNILSLYTLEEQVYTYARQYLTIYGGGSVFLAFSIIQATILRSYGYAREAMFASIIANIFNICGNAVSIYGLFGLPILGVTGVAVSTVISQGIACFIVALRIKKHDTIKIPWKKFKRIPAAYFRKMLKIGIPSAAENLSYNICQMFITGLIAVTGTASLSANVYVLTVARFVFMPAISIGYAVQIKAGYLAGAGRFSEAKKKVFLYNLIGYGITAILASALYLLRKPVLGIFTADESILQISYSLLFIVIFREIARVTNVIIIPALKGTGDVLFPAAVGVIIQWLAGAGGAFLSLHFLDMGLKGVYWAMTADEGFRSLAILLRWKSDAWQSKNMVTGDRVLTPG